jgi:3-oxoadipate enol-lactonase
VIHKNGNIDIHYELHGPLDDANRPWIVFSHSLACASEMWRPQIAEFAGDYRVLTFDTRGHGRSSAPAAAADYANYHFDALVSDVATLLDALKIEKPDFVGLSMGGMLGQAFAIKHPGRLKSLTIADSVCEWPAGSAETFASRVEQARQGGMKAVLQGSLDRWFTAPYRQSNTAEIDAIAQMILTTKVDGYAGCSYSIPRINFTKELAGIKAPILVMTGRHDPATTVALAEQIHEASPGSILEIIEGAAHLSNVENPKAFNGAIRRFLQA